jgi:exosortase
MCVMGSELVWRFLPAFLVLALLVPVPGLVRQQITLPMQTATAEVTHQLLTMLGYHVPRSGNTLTINGTTVGIAAACNGLRMVFALVLVSYAFAFATPLTWYSRALVIALAPVAAIVCNVIRLVPTVWLYGYGPEPWADAFHELAGWAMLIVAFFLLMGVVRLIQWATNDPGSTAFAVTRST